MKKQEILDVLQKLAKDATDGFLDGASNLSGVSMAYHRAVKTLNDYCNLEGTPGGTTYKNNHPLLSVYIKKMCHLNGVQLDPDFAHRFPDESLVKKYAEGEFDMDCNSVTFIKSKK